MCGRFTLIAPGELIADEFGLAAVPTVAPRYNIAPTQPVAAIRIDNAEERELTYFHWGLIPFWATDIKMASRMINARSETVAEKPAYRAAFKRRRCLVPASGFYEWKKVNGGKQPVYIHPVNKEVMAIAGIWEQWHSDDGSEIESVSLLTTSPNERIKDIHNRMPVIIEQPDYSTWLDPSLEKGDVLFHLMRPIGSDFLDSYPVSTLVNNPRNDVAEVLEPAS
jgi:putative SOS response-associated peptidase YedK